MGVPSFYRWLAEKYPKIVVDAVETTEEKDGAPAKNPNGREFDNLYLDMNGIIHPCFHPEHDDLNSPETYEEVFSNIFEYIDWIMMIVRPRKLLYLAIDGVAPRAKMNQQRTRRFKTAKDHETLVESFFLVIKETEVSDNSNIITPGTSFMFELSKQLQRYVHLRISKNPAWKHLKVILSDANAPGEGEHKIMSFIRLQRTCPGYNPNTSHVLYGLDADLIMLALATHEIYFSILREVRASIFFFFCKIGLKDTTEQIFSNVSKQKSLVKKPHQFLHVWILRQYLDLHLRTENLPQKFEYDIERLIDDFIFISFLPHMPTLALHEINDKKGGYMNLKRVEKFILAVGSYEDQIFKKRSAIHDSQLRRMLLQTQEDSGNGDEELFPVIRSNCNLKNSSVVSDPHLLDTQKSPDLDFEIVENTKALMEKLKSYTRETSDVFRHGLTSDMVKLGSPGWRQRYYKYKFSAETDVDMENTRKKVVEKYTEGLCWVLKYYFSDVPSWTCAQALPPQYQSLMTSDDSSILDFYPDDFNVDTDGKRFLWQGICKLPFIDEERLLAETKKIENELSVSVNDIQTLYSSDQDHLKLKHIYVVYIQEVDAKRNGENVDKLFLHSDETLSMWIILAFNDSGTIEGNRSIKIDTSLSVGRDEPHLPSRLPPAAIVYLPTATARPPPNRETSTPNRRSRKVGECSEDEIPDVLYWQWSSSSDHFQFLRLPLLSSQEPSNMQVVSESDIMDGQLWHESRGYPSRINIRSHGQKAEENPSVGYASGWRGRGRGRGWGSVHNPACNSSQSSGIEESHFWHDNRSYPNRNYRSQEQVQAMASPSIGSSSGWRGRGRGGVHDSASHHEATRIPKDQTNSSSWWNTHGRGARRSENADNQSTNYNSRTNNVNGQIWSVIDSSSNSNQARGQGQGTQSKYVSNSRWQRY
ncbi:hypothetical protein LXL04_022848 [Taraxacum kok-saghyz]